MIVPMNCGTCVFYNGEGFCNYREIHVGNINSCSSWRPQLKILVQKNVEFVPYNQYRIEDERVNRSNLVG